MARRPSAGTLTLGGLLAGGTVAVALPTALLLHAAMRPDRLAAQALGAACDRVLGHLPGPIIVIQAGALVLLVAVLGVGGATLIRQWYHTRRLAQHIHATRRPLSRQLTRLAQHTGVPGRLDVVPGQRPLAFCYGWWQPRVCLTTALNRMLPGRALAAVLRHEGHHARWRDPLRAAVSWAIVRAGFFLPILQLLHMHDTLARELAADRAAAAPPFGRGPLAQALHLLVSARPSASDDLLPPGVVAFDGGARASPSLLAARIDQLLAPDCPPSLAWTSWASHRLLLSIGSLVLGLCILFNL